MTTTISPNLTHHGQNRDQETGAPVRRRESDEIVLFLREVACAAAKCRQVKSTVRQSGMSLGLGDTLYSMSQLRCHRQRTLPQAFPRMENWCLSHSNFRLLVHRVAEGWRYLEQHLHNALCPPPVGSRKIFSVQGKAAPQSGNHGRPDLAGLTALCVEGRWGGGNGVAAGLCVCWVGAGHDIWPVVSVTARSVCELMKPCLRLVIRPREKGNRSVNELGPQRTSEQNLISQLL